MYIALVYEDKISEIRGFDTEEELDKFALRTHHIVFAFTADDFDAYENDDYTAPFAVYMRGRRWDCVKKKE
jgi:hypothetical protein